MTSNVRRFPFVQLDVFTSRPLEGNALAVFPDARALNDPEMQALAREMNLSETTFVLPRDPQTEALHGVRVRIFTVQEELDFAGHPTLGTATVLRDAGGPDKQLSEIALHLNVGKIPVTFRAGESGNVFGEMRQRDPEMGAVRPREEVALAAGLAVDDIDPDLPIQTVSTGVPFTIVPLRRRETLRKLPFQWGHAAEYLERSGCHFFYFVTRDITGSGPNFGPEAARARVHARMIFYNGEDPATGSAAGCCAAWMVRHGVAQSGEQVLIAQGLEMRRPSFIYVQARGAGEQVSDVRVGGYTVEVLRGEVVL